MHNSQKTVMDYLETKENKTTEMNKLLPEGLIPHINEMNHIVSIVDQVMSVMFKKPEVKMEAIPLYDEKSEAHQSLQDKALEYLPDEMKSLFADPNSLREVVNEMTNDEMKQMLSYGPFWRACFRYLQPVAWEAAQKRAEAEL